MKDVNEQYNTHIELSAISICKSSSTSKLNVEKCHYHGSVTIQYYSKRCQIMPILGRN